MFKSGFVSIVGEPNVGKSTIMNAFLNEKIAITTYKPQTTRTRILGVLTTEPYQMVFLDTPGIHQPKDRLGEVMVKTAYASMADGDVVLHVVDVTRKKEGVTKDIENKLRKMDAPKILVLNKIDLLEKEKLLPMIEEQMKKNLYSEIVPISALKKEGTTLLLDTIETYLTEGPKYFPDDQVTDQPEKAIVSELIREKVLQLMQEEIPHGVAVVIDSMKEANKQDIMHIEATIYVERESHKGMLIGKGGKMLKEIGTRSRKDIERFLGERVYLDIWVKTKKNWKNSEMQLKNFGFENE